MWCVACLGIPSGCLPPQFRCRVQFEGQFAPHPRGFGFVDPAAPVTLTDEEGRQHVIDSSFVAPDVARGWLAGDRVRATVEIDEQGRGTNVTAMELLERPRRFVVGIVHTFAGSLVLKLDNRIGAGQIPVAAELGQQLRLAEGRQIVAMLGTDEQGQPVASNLVVGPDPAQSPTAVRARAVAVAHGGATPDTIAGGATAVGLSEAEALGYALRSTGHLAAGRAGLSGGLAADVGPVPGIELELVDRRGETAITIDSDSTRDLDDALTATWTGVATDPVQVVVSIADAAGTIGLGSPADVYAATMGTSAYFIAGANAPMLDPSLSEGELSLLPDVPRRAVNVRMEVHADGTTSGVVLETAWIQTAARLSYESVDGYVADADPIHLAMGMHGPNGSPLESLLEVTTTVAALMEAARRLGAARDARDTLESLFVNATLEPAVVGGKIRAVPADPHEDAQQLVERLMVATNEAVATWAVSHAVPLLFRSHAGFDKDRLPRFRAAAAALDVDLGDEIDPASVLTAIERLRAEGRAEAADVLASAATGAVARANYTSTPSGHTALGSDAYTHFTSPLRRYADLLVHRQVRAALAGEELPYTAEQLDAWATWLEVRAGAADHASRLERNALWAILLDRGAVTWPSEAVVTGVQGKGLRVRLLVPGIAGFVPAAHVLKVPFKDRPTLEMDEHELGTADGAFRPGTRIKVSLDRVDETGRPDLKLV